MARVVVVAWVVVVGRVVVVVGLSVVEVVDDTSVVTGAPVVEVVVEPAVVVVEIRVVDSTLSVMVSSGGLVEVGAWVVETEDSSVVTDTGEEGTGTVVEVSACGVPVVVTDEVAEVTRVVVAVASWPGLAVPPQPTVNAITRPIDARA